VFCPKCGDEYRPGFTRCADCDVDLVDKLPDVEEPPPFEMVTVLETGDQSLAAVAESILQGAGIPFIARNERLQNLFGWGTIGTGYSVAMGPIRLQVLKEDAEIAKELLVAHTPPESEDGDA
jgi:putative signal transducing protein